MTRILVGALLLALGTSSTALAKKRISLPESDSYRRAPWADAFQKELDRVLKGYTGELAIYVSDPYLGHRFGYRDQEPMYLASGVKLAFMLGIYSLRSRGQLEFNETISYSEDDVRDGAPRVNKQRMGAAITIATLLDWMMRSSDNAASDMLAERVGLRNVNKILLMEGIEGFTPLTFLIDVRRGIYRNLDVRADDLSPHDIRRIRWTPIWNPQVRRINELLGRPKGTYNKNDLMLAYKRFYGSGVNRAPMQSVGLIFEKMLRSEMIDEKASKDMLQLMTGARTSTHRLLGKLPRGTRVAHKTGSQFERLCDLGAIYLPDGKPIVVTACTKEGGVPQSEAVIARLARKAYDLVSEHRKSIR